MRASFCLLLPALLSMSGWLTASAADQPNIVLVIADDCTCRDLGVYGGQAKTPHLNRLASEGMKFTRCFQAAPMCSPTRHCLYTGLYPVKSGAYPNHTMAYDWVRSVAHYLQPAGYRTYLSGKTHINPKSVFPFDYSARRGDGNPDPEATFQKAATKDSSFKTWQRMAAEGDKHAQRLVHDYQHRPAEELYDCDADPWNRINLGGDENLATVRDELRARLDAWMQQQGDEGQATEMKALERMPKSAAKPTAEPTSSKRQKKAKAVPLD